ncbi:hypothetical protein D3C80_1521340 [compost metagenome]
MQVHVRDIGADIGRSGQADLGVEVGAVHVHLATLAVDNFADLADTFLVHPMGRRIGRHQARQALSCRLRLGLEVGQIDVTGLVTLDDYHLHPRHLRRRRVGAVG